MRVYCVYRNGEHLDCFDTFTESEAFVTSFGNRLSTCWNIEKAYFDPHCSCGNLQLSKRDYDRYLEGTGEE